MNENLKINLHVTALKRISPGNGIDSFEIYYNLYINDKLSNSFITPYRDALNPNFEEIDYRIAPSRNLASSWKECIMNQVKAIDIIDESYKSQTGWVIDNNAPYFVLNGTKYDKFCTINDYEIFKKFIELLNGLTKIENGSGITLLCYVFFSYTRKLFVEGGYDKNFACILTGNPGTKKTSLSTLITNIDSNSQPQSLESTEATLRKTFSQHSDICYLLDDLHRSGNSSEMKRREKSLSSIVRILANGIARTSLCGNEKKEEYIDSGIVITAEYLPEGISTLERIIILQLDKPITNKLMSYIQNNDCMQDIAPIYISFLCENYTNLVEFIGEQLSNFSKVTKKKSKNIRLLQMYFSLETTLLIIKKFLNHYSINLSSNGMEILYDCISSWYHQQSSTMKKMYNQQDPDRFSKALSEMYSHNLFIFSKKEKHIKNGEAAIIHKGNLCATPSYFLHSLQYSLKDKTITENQIINELRNNRILCMDKSNRSTKKLFGVRMLHVPILQLEKYYSSPIKSNFDRF